jgi:hypothetical protein
MRIRLTALEKRRAARTLERQSRLDQRHGEAWPAEHWDRLPESEQGRWLMAAALHRQNPTPTLWVVMRDNHWGPWQDR